VLLGDQADGGEMNSTLITVLVVLAIIALVLFIVRR
jgi:hypothetical protein